MTRSTLFDRLNHELEAFGRKAQAALDEGKLQIELMRVRRRRDLTAKDLGLLIHRKERGGELEPRRVDALLLRLDDLEAELGRLERHVAEAKRQRPSRAGSEPARPSGGPSAAGTPASGAPETAASTSEAAGAASATGVPGSETSP